MINSSDRIADFPDKFNELEKRVKFLEKKITEIEGAIGKEQE